MSEIRSKEWLDKGRELRERAALSDTIWRTETTDFGGYSARDAHAVADHLWTEGYRKPRTVNSAAELDALPELSVVLVGGQLAAQKDIDWYAVAGGDPIYFKPDAWEAGIVILFTPGDAG